MNRIALGGGCHWCTEAVFDALRGTTVTQGYACSDPPHDDPSEAALIEYDEGIVPLEVLIAIHVRTHASGAEHSMRGRYRSAVYVTSQEQRDRSRAALDAEARELGPLVVRVLPLRDFDPSPERFRRYYETRGPDAPFCRTHIDPKLALLRRDYTDRLKR